MQSLEVIKFAERLLTTPAAPYHETEVKAQARAIASEADLAAEEDESGNLLVTVSCDGALRPLVLAAHLDHPSFVIKSQLSSDTWLAEFKGGVGDPWFKPGVPVLLMPGRVPGRLGRRPAERLREFEITAAWEPETPPLFAVWDLPEFEIEDGKLIGRSCDDLVGCATVLAVLAQLQRAAAPVHVIGALCRAEEVGFHGALCLAQSGRIPANALIISLETSRELPPAKMGEGVIIRVGDKASIFDPEATRFLGEVASDLQKPAEFKFQRALMSGGTCEGTAYQEFGYQTAAVCVALGNYHNCAEPDVIRAEYVSLADVAGMVRLLTAAAEAMPRYADLTGRLPRRLEGYAREARTALRPAHFAG